MNDHPSILLADAGFAGVGIAALFQWLPPLAAALTIIWTLIRIYETKTFQVLLVRYIPWAVLSNLPPTVNVENMNIRNLEVNHEGKPEDRA